jgi:endonuclease YncB( thermonuclease family)
MIRRYWKDPLNILILICTSLLLFLFLTPAISPAVIRTVEGTVTQVSDGDTFKLETAEGTKLKIRLYGIDAPEIERINRRTGLISKQGQPYGKSSYEVLEAKILRRKVKVDVIAIDRYKRMVGIVYLEGREINLEMVKGGWAWAYREYLDRPYASEYLNAEKEARGKRLGLWQQSNPQPPWEFRKLIKTSYDRET